MKILFNDKKATIRLKTESLDDLYHLSHIIREGDRIKKKTMRKIKIDLGDRQELDKKPMTLTLEVEKVDFHPYTGKLRVGGLIVEGPEDISGHHTFSIDVNDVITLVKEWSSDDMERIKLSQTKTPDVVIVAIDRENAVFARLKPYGPETVARIGSHLPRKGEDGYDSALEQYYKEVVAKLRSFSGEKIVGGPGFAKEHIKKLLPEIHIETASSASESGIREMISGETIDEVVGETRTKFESGLVEKLLKEIAQEGKYGYGFENVTDCNKTGSIETLLVSEQTILDYRKKKIYLKLDGLMKDVENKGGRIVIVSKEHEHGQKLIALGGLGAILRWKR